MKNCQLDMDLTIDVCSSRLACHVVVCLRNMIRQLTFSPPTGELAFNTADCSRQSSTIRSIGVWCHTLYSYNGAILVVIECYGAI